MNEKERLSFLSDLGIKDSESDSFIDNLTKLAQSIYNMKISLVSIVAKDKLWFISRAGLNINEAPKLASFCDKCVSDQSVLIVPNALEDDEFNNSPLVKGPPHIVFYAGAPITLFNKFTIGTFCLIDDIPRELTISEQEQLKILAKQVSHYLEMKYEATVQKKISEMLSTLHRINSKNITDLDLIIEEYLRAGSELIDLEYGIQSKIEGEVYLVENVISPNNEIAKNSIFELPNTYCDYVVKARNTISIEEVGAIIEMRGHPVYEGMKLESYISTPIWVEGKIYGTLNFSSKSIRKTKFTDSEKHFLELMAVMISRKIILRENNREIETLFKIMDETPEIISLADFETKEVSYLNKALSKISGGKGVGSHISEFYTKERFKQIVNDALPEVIAKGSWKGESAILNAEGIEIPVLQTIVAHKDEDNQITHLSTIVQDISKRKEIEKNLLISKEAAENASKSKTEFLANMSHEIRTPMNGILGMISLLKETNLTQEQLSLVNNVETCGDGLLVVLNDILDLSKIEIGKLELEKTSFSLPATIDDVVSLFTFRSIEKNNEISSSYNEEIPMYLHADPLRIKQIIINFVSNAIKFTTNGKINVICDYKNIDEDNIQLSISVEDNGKGIAKENLNKIFEPFSQEDSSTTRKFGGTGLGLSICTRLAELMGGEILLESELGKGSIFTLVIPVEIAKNGPSELVTEVKTGAKSSNLIHFSQDYPHDILVVEDNLINQKLAKTFLAKLGYEVDIAHNGQVAVEMCKQKKYSFIFMDMQMPVMGGVEATEIILKSSKHPPLIVAMTANVFEEDKESCFKAGMKEFLSKPFKLDDFISVITKCSFISDK